jgi:hypothetical protein
MPPSDDDIAKIVEEEARLIKENPPKLPDVRDINSYELYSKIDSMIRPDESLIPSQITQLPGLFFLEGKHVGYVAGQVNSSGYYILRYYGLSNLVLCKFEDIWKRDFFDQPDILELTYKRLAAETAGLLHGQNLVHCSQDTEDFDKATLHEWIERYKS